MLADYEDIKKRVKIKPKWYDCNGTPRYDKFHPDLSPNIYADEVILMRIGCQRCRKEFLVEMNWGSWELVNEIPKLSKRIKDKSIHYGDPPSHIKTDHAGSTMNCIDYEIVEFWKKNKKFDWVRDKKLEIKLEVDLK